MTEILAGEIIQEKETKEIQIGKEKGKLSLFPKDTGLYRRDPQNST